MTHNTGYLDRLEFISWLKNAPNPESIADQREREERKKEWKKELVDRPLINDQEEDSYCGDYQLYNAEWHFSYGNINHIVDLLKSDQELTWRTRDFIADILSGKLKRKNNRPRDPEYEYILFDLFQRCRDEGLAFEKADERVSDEIERIFNKTEKSATKKYQKIKKELDKEAEETKITDPDEIKKILETATLVISIVNSVFRTEGGNK